VSEGASATSARCKAADSALEVDGDDGLTVIVNDLIGDIHGKVLMTPAASLD
jgi:hypothetical protein